MIKLFLTSIIAAVVFCVSYNANAQLIDNSSTFRKISRNSYFRFHYDNDYFTKTDEYYSQGITFDFVHPAIKRFPLSKLLWKPFTTAPQYGISFNIFGYTPTSILSDSILYGDRPFDGNISLKTMLIQVDEQKHQQISSAFSIGVMGPAALGYEIQYNIHNRTGNPLPHGWEYEVKNDVIINYQLNYEKQLIAKGNNFLLTAVAEARLGTLNTLAGGGFNLMAGHFNKRFTPVSGTKRKAEYYFYTQISLN